jgi:hypothetical protein
VKGYGISLNDTERWKGKRSWILLAGFLAVCFLYCLTPVHNGNFFWHLRNGEDILENGEIRTSDPFTWTCHGETWLQQEWAAEVLFAVSWKTIGESGPVLFKALLITLSVLLIYLAARKRGASVQAVVLTGILWFTLSHGRWIVRPHIVSIFFFSLYLYLLARGTGGFMKTLAVFLPLQIVWVNAHAGFVMGYFLLGIPVLENIFSRSWKKAGKAAGVLVTAALCCGIHPNGYGSFIYITDFLSRPLFRQTITEWWSPFHSMYQPGHAISTTAILLVMLLAATWTLVLIRRKAIGLPRMIALAALSTATLLSSRNIDMLALAAVAWTAPLLPKIPFRLSAVMLVVVAVIPFVAGVPREIGPPRNIGLGVDWSVYPTQMARFLDEHDELMETRIFNTNEISGYLEYTFGEKLQLYMDGRCHLYPESMYAEYLIMAFARMEDANRVRSIVDNRGINLAIYDWPKTNESSAYVLSMSPEWYPVYWDDIGIIYGRVTFLDSIGMRWHSFPNVDPLFPDILLETPFYLVPENWKDELLLSASPPMNYQPSLITAAALLQSGGSSILSDSLPFVFRSDSISIALRSALEGVTPCLSDPRLTVIQSWALSREGRFEMALEVAKYSGDVMLEDCTALLAGRALPVNSQPPLMIPVLAWNRFLRDDLSPGDSMIVRAAAMFVCGMRDSSMISIHSVMNRSVELSAWAFSVSGGLAALTGQDSLASIWGDSALALRRNLYTLMIRGNIAGIVGDSRSAAEFFSECLEISDSFQEARNQRARNLWITGEINEAMQDYRLLRQLNYLTPATESIMEWGEHFTQSRTHAEVYP